MHRITSNRGQLCSKVSLPFIFINGLKSIQLLRLLLVNWQLPKKLFTKSEVKWLYRPQRILSCIDYENQTLDKQCIPLSQIILKNNKFCVKSDSNQIFAWIWLFVINLMYSNGDLTVRLSMVYKLSTDLFDGKSLKLINDKCRWVDQKRNKSQMGYILRTTTRNLIAPLSIHIGQAYIGPERQLQAIQ